jgi:hypothetical protein
LLSETANIDIDAVLKMKKSNPSFPFRIATVFFCIAGFAGANDLPCGDVNPHVYSEDNCFIIQYSNTKTWKYLEDKFISSGYVVYRRKQVDKSASTKRINQGLSNIIPTGKNGPLGNYGFQDGLSICFYKDSILYAIIGPSVSGKIEIPFLEIKERTKRTHKIKVNWRRDTFDFHGCKLFIDGNTVVGTMSSPNHDTLYMFRTAIKNPDSVTYKVIGLYSKSRHPSPNAAIQGFAHTTTIKKYNDRYVIVFADGANKPEVAFWNCENDLVVIKPISINAIKGTGFPSDFNIINDRILFAWVIKRNSSDNCSSAIVESSCKIPLKK